MALTPSWPGPTGAASTTDGRKAVSGLIAKDTAGVVRTGVFPRHLNALVAARVDMNVDIGIFEGVASQFGGAILLTNDAVAQLPSVLVSPGAGTNFYVIYAKQNESTAPGTDVNNLRVFGAALSTTSFALARASMPAGALELATVQMPTGKTATNNAGVTITQTFQYTATSGGPVTVRNSTELAAWLPADGNLAYQVDTKVLWSREGGQWVPGDGNVEKSYATFSSGSVTAGTVVSSKVWATVPYDTVIEADVLGSINNGSGTGVSVNYTLAGSTGAGVVVTQPAVTATQYIGTAGAWSTAVLKARIAVPAGVVATTNLQVITTTNPCTAQGAIEYRRVPA